MNAKLTESVVEEAALTWLAALGYAVLHGPEIAAGELRAERSDPNYRDVVLEQRLRQSLVRLNPDLPAEALEDGEEEARGLPRPGLGAAQEVFAAQSDRDRLHLDGGGRFVM